MSESEKDQASVKTHVITPKNGASKALMPQAVTPEPVTPKPAATQPAVNPDAPAPAAPSRKPEVGGPKGPEPTRYGDWEKSGRCVDF